jgi:hypothetical protein
VLLLESPVAIHITEDATPRRIERRVFQLCDFAKDLDASQQGPLTYPFATGFKCYGLSAANSLLQDLLRRATQALQNTLYINGAADLVCQQLFPKPE